MLEVRRVILCLVSMLSFNLRLITTLCVFPFPLIIWEGQNKKPFYLKMYPEYACKQMLFYFYFSKSCCPRFLFHIHLCVEGFINKNIFKTILAKERRHNNDALCVSKVASRGQVDPSFLDVRSFLNEETKDSFFCLYLFNGILPLK